MTDPRPFEDAPNVLVVTQKSILQHGRPILYVSHDEDDGGWQFLDGGPIRTEDGMVVSLKFMLIRDPSIALVADLPMGWSATRITAVESWTRKREKEPS